MVEIATKKVAPGQLWRVSHPHAVALSAPQLGVIQNSADLQKGELFLILEPEAGFPTWWFVSTENGHTVVMSYTSITGLAQLISDSGHE